MLCSPLNCSHYEQRTFDFINGLLPPFATGEGVIPKPLYNTIISSVSLFGFVQRSVTFVNNHSKN